MPFKNPLWGVQVEQCLLVMPLKLQPKEMNNQDLHRKVDLAVFSLANLMNIIMLVVFLARAAGVARINIVGGIWVAFIIVLSTAVWLNIRGRREWWAIVLPSVLMAFLILEIILDYVLKINFRSTRLIGPYLLLYYLALFGMIGYAFQIGKRFGFITLLTYFIHQSAMLYSYFWVGHG